MIKPFWSDGQVTLYHGETLAVLYGLKDAGFRADLGVVDPPYADTHHEWDTWPFGWPTALAEVTDSMWCFGSARMFDTDEYRNDIRYRWKMSHDVIWEKNAATANLKGDRFNRVHEHVRHFYRNGVRWESVHHTPRRVPGTKKAGESFNRSALGASVHGVRGATRVRLDGFAYPPSVQRHPKVWRSGIHPSQKPVTLLEELILYGSPPDGMVIDPMAGSGSTGKACQMRGRRAVLIEGREDYCEAAARWLSETPMVAEPDPEPPLPLKGSESLF